MERLLPTAAMFCSKAAHLRATRPKCCPKCCLCLARKWFSPSVLAAWACSTCWKSPAEAWPDARYCCTAMWLLLLLMAHSSSPGELVCLDGRH
eukprot:1152791-Pelagomonas_calceolata.AAC.5